MDGGPAVLLTVWAPPQLADARRAVDHDHDAPYWTLTHRRATPLIVPTFTKCRQNLDEMEVWYDHWLKILSQAVITAPSTHAGQIPDHACADMSPPTRRPCMRINSRMTILSDGTIPTCEQDVQAQQPQGHSLTDQILPTWQQKFPILRQNHGTQPLCATCTEWHRP